MKETAPNKSRKGRITAIIGPVIDVKFDDCVLPKIYERLLVA